MTSINPLSMAQAQDAVRMEALMHLRSGWPKRGTLTACYQQTGGSSEWRQEVAFDFATGCWYLFFADDRNSSRALSRDGSVVLGTARLDHADPAVGDPSAALDHYFPSFHLAALLSDKEAWQGKEIAPNGDFLFYFLLPRGQRTQRIDQIPSTLVEQLGGAAALMRKVVFTTDPQHRPLRVQVETSPIVCSISPQPGRVVSLSASSVLGPLRRFIWIRSP